MCGNYDSVIGMDKHVSVRRFVTRMPASRSPGCRGEGMWRLYRHDDQSGLTRRIEPVRVGGRLAPHVPVA